MYLHPDKIISETLNLRRFSSVPPLLASSFTTTSLRTRYTDVPRLKRSDVATTPEGTILYSRKKLSVSSKSCRDLVGIYPEFTFGQRTNQKKEKSRLKKKPTKRPAK